MIDWVAGGSLVTAALAILAAAVSYGVQRQKVRDLQAQIDRINKDNADAEQHYDAQFERVWKAVETINQTNQAVAALRGSIETLTSRMESGHTLMLTKLEASDNLTTTKLDALARAVGKSAT